MPLFLLAFLFFFTRPAKKYPNKQLMIFGLILCALLPILWISWVNMHGFTESMLHARSFVTPEKALILCRRLAAYCVENKFILTMLVLLAAALFESRKGIKEDSCTFLLWEAVFLFAFCVIALSGWPVEKLKTTSLEVFQRLFLHAAPIVLLFFVSQCPPAKRDTKH